MLPRLQLLEICDQAWLPSPLRSRLQTCLTLLWRLHVPVLQAHSPAYLASRTLRQVLRQHLQDVVPVDFCAGAGGPTPLIERELNAFLEAEGNRPVDFVLTDILPHPRAWTEAAEQSPQIHYVEESVDATAPPSQLLTSPTLMLSPLCNAETRQRIQHRKILALFFLAFHHFTDDLAEGVIRAALDTSTDSQSDGFAIFELQGRTFREILMVLLTAPLIMLVAPLYFWHDPLMLFFVYVVPVIPLILAFDGTVSCLRTRTDEEIMALVEGCGVDLSDWRFIRGSEVHTWPLGKLRYFVALRR